VRVFRTLFETQSIGACLIHGEEDYGQKWLLNRLIQLIPNSTTAKIISIPLGRKSQANYIDALWRQLAGRVGLTARSSPPEIVQKVYKLCEHKPVILICDDADEMPKEYMNEFMSNFWLPLVDKLQNYPPRTDNYRLLMFLLDHQGCIEQCDIPLVDKLDTNWQAHIPIKLPKITNLCERDLTNWIDAGIDELPLNFTNQIEETIQDILENSEQGLPMLALQRICEMLDCNWYDWEDKWLKY
jgi:hypothetical protein